MDHSLLAIQNRIVTLHDKTYGWNNNEYFKKSITMRLVDDPSNKSWQITELTPKPKTDQPH